MGEDGTFKESLCNDAQGTLALYEAAYMRVEGEQVLDKALEFTKIHLDIIAKDPSCDSYLRTQIHQALKQPFRRRLARIEALHYIPIYQQETSHNDVLLKLAKLDFSVLQSMHKKELSHICKYAPYTQSIQIVFLANLEFNLAKVLSKHNIESKLRPHG